LLLLLLLRGNLLVIGLHSTHSRNSRAQKRSTQQHSSPSGMSTCVNMTATCTAVLAQQARAWWACLVAAQLRVSF
jgi:hypothetical protein